MKTLVASLKDQLIDAKSIGKTIEIKNKKSFNNVLITGLGGSGIGGSIVKDLVYNFLKLPLSINKGYDLPASVTKDTLVIVSSFSGNTEETVICLEKALKIGATIFCITSGGFVLEKAKEEHLDYIQLPTAKSPRAMLSYSLTQLLYSLKAYGLIDDMNLDEEFDASVELISSKTNEIQESAMTIANSFHNKIPLLYSVDGFDGVCVRFKQQINENAKMLAWHHIVPEMNHNELVGWTKENKNLSVLFLRNKIDHSRNVIRMDLNRDIISKYSDTREIYSLGDSQLENTFFWIHLGDWVSLILSEMNEVDPIEVNVIDFLKSELGKA